MSRFSNQVSTSNSTLGSSQSHSSSWTSVEDAYVSEAVNLTTAASTIDVGSVLTPRIYQFGLVAGSDVEVSVDNGSTYPFRLSGVGDGFFVRSNVEALKEISTLTVGADVSGSLNTKYFLLYDKDGSVGFWIDIDDSGSTIPAGASGATRAVEITTLVTDDTAATVADALAVAINADDQFSAVSDGVSLVTVTDTHLGTRTNISAGDTGWSVATTQGGAAAPVVKAKSVATSTLNYIVAPN